MCRTSKCDVYSSVCIGPLNANIAVESLHTGVCGFVIHVLNRRTSMVTIHVVMDNSFPTSSVMMVTTLFRLALTDATELGVAGIDVACPLVARKSELSTSPA